MSSYLEPQSISIYGLDHLGRGTRVLTIIPPTIQVPGFLLKVCEIWGLMSEAGDILKAVDNVVRHPTGYLTDQSSDSSSWLHCK